MNVEDKKKGSKVSFLMGIALVSAGGAFTLGCGGGVDVNGTIIDTFVWEGGEATVPRTSEETAISALVIDSDGDSDEFEGELHEDGSFHISGVPEGGYYLRFSAPDGTSASGSGTFYWTSERAIEFGVTIRQRPDAKQITSSSTEIAVNVGGLNPWQSDDSVYFYASGAQLYAILSQLTLPTEGATELGSVKLDAASLEGANLIDGSKGDRAYITQLTSRGTESFPYSSVAKALKAEPFTMTDGEAVGVSGSLEDVPQQTMSIDWKHSMFKDTVNVPVLSEWAHLRIHHRGTPSPLLDAFGTLQDVSADVTFGNPFPAELELLAVVDASFATEEGPADHRQITFRCSTPISGAGSVVLAPDVSAVTNITLNKTGSSPILSWKAPSADGPVYYRISVVREEAPGGIIYTPETSAAIPDILVTGGELYQFRVRAIRGELDLTKRGASSSTCYAEAWSEWLNI